jgi:hypothetical protein
VKGLVTIAIGNLVDPLAYAMVLPMVDKVTGTAATRDQIAREWQRVKHDPTLARLGHRAAAHVTSLRLTPEGIQRVVLGKLDEVDRQLAKRFPSWEAQPADGQLLVLSMSWAMGAAFRFPAFEAAFARGDYRACADECKMNEQGNPGLAPRNVMNRQLARNAAWVVETGGDYDRLYWPGVAANEAPTLPMLPDAPETPLPVTEEDGGVSRWAATRASVRGEGPAG